jgi:hypothetical protein
MLLLVVRLLADRILAEMVNTGLERLHMRRRVGMCLGSVWETMISKNR